MVSSGKRPIHGGEAADRAGGPSMAAQVPDVHGGRLRRGVPLLNRAPGTAGDVVKAPPHHVDDEAAVSSSSFTARRGGEASSEVWRALEGGVARGQLGDKAAADAELAEGARSRRFVTPTDEQHRMIYLKQQQQQLKLLPSMNPPEHAVGWLAGHIAPVQQEKLLLHRPLQPPLPHVLGRRYSPRLAASEDPDYVSMLDKATNPSGASLKELGRRRRHVLFLLVPLVMIRLLDLAKDCTDPSLWRMLLISLRPAMLIWPTSRARLLRRLQ
ncbi:hypothetical protein HU200_011600 [Digitaria exilis]|uniref:Uncharacterized protein n=1 Tax=Digitaria exilis TaxID=1010633 RepID=A0A835KNY6_9POAL|nr:hypothetical protein HU200_011600 [Digitaria exilis]